MMGHILDRSLEIIRSRCNGDPEGDKAYKFLIEWIEVSKEMGLDPDYVREIEHKIEEQKQLGLFK